jgi:hypothetical protein
MLVGIVAQIPTSNFGFSLAMMYIVYYVQILELYNFAFVFEEFDPDNPKLAHFRG